MDPVYDLLIRCALTLVLFGTSMINISLNSIPIPIPSIGKRPIPIPVSIVLIMSVEHGIIRLLLMPLLRFYANSRTILVICTSISAPLPHQPANEKASHTYLKARPFILTFL